MVPEFTCGIELVVTACDCSYMQCNAIIHYTCTLTAYVPAAEEQTGHLRDSRSLQQGSL